MVKTQLFLIEFTHLQRYKATPTSVERSHVMRSQCYVVAESMELALVTAAEGREQFGLVKLEVKAGPGLIELKQQRPVLPTA